MVYGKTTKTQDRMYLFGAIAIGLLLFVVLSQPIWRGEQMVSNMRTNCDKVGGVMLETKGMFGITYECSPRYDVGVKK